MYPHQDDHKEPLSVWGEKWGEEVKPLMLQAEYYPDNKPVSEWEARIIFHRWNGSPLPAESDSTDAEVEVELTIKAKVKVTSLIRQGCREQYDYPDSRIWNNERMAKDILYASINPLLPADNQSYPDYWDGVGNMQGLIRDIELDTD